MILLKRGTVEGLCGAGRHRVHFTIEEESVLMLSSRATFDDDLVLCLGIHKYFS